VTELLVGVPFPAVALELLRLRAGDAQASSLALSGATFGAGEALARGLVDEAVPAAELAGRSLAAAQRLATLGPAFGLTKCQLRQRFLARVHDLAVFDAEVDAIWKAPETLEPEVSDPRSWVKSGQMPSGPRDGADISPFGHERTAWNRCWA
jgi:enoyl-CoA hydratase